jgi:hypothetical protein
MIEDIKAKLARLELMKSDASPKITELNEKRAEEIANVNKKYDHLVEDISIEVKDFENRIMGDLINLFTKMIMEEFDAKRSTSEYTLTDGFKNFRDEMGKINLFPPELIERMDKVINGDPIENLAYDIEKFEAKYK